MNDRNLIRDEPDYLWDGSGEPDADIAKLESLLGGLRHRGAAPVEPAAPAASLRLHHDPVPSMAVIARWPRRLSIAAMIALGLLTAVLCPRSPSRWNVEPLSGSPTVGSSRLNGPEPLRAGHWIETDANSRARIEIAGLGDVRIEPGTRIRVVSGPANRRLMDLARGSIHAFVTAPPRMFQINTPAARAIDMGCEYTLKVDESGAGELRVLLGYVLLQWGGRTVTIPMNGGMCLTRPGFGPGTPFFDDAPTRFIQELQRLDFESGGEPALNAVLSEARPRDALSVWHLLQTVDSGERGTVYDRLSQLKPPPEGVMRAGILALDPAMLDAWWDDMRPF